MVALSLPLLAGMLGACAPLSNRVHDPTQIPDNDLGDEPAAGPADCTLVGWWPLDDGGGGWAADASGAGHDLELLAPQGGPLPTWGDGHDGTGGLVFDVDPAQSDRSSQAAVSWEAGLQDHTELTLMLWVRTDQPMLHAQTLAGLGGDRSWFNPVSLGLSQEWTLRAHLADEDAGFVFDSDASIVRDAWVHVALVADGTTGTWSVYQDGTRVGGSEQPFSRFPDLGGPFLLGADHNEDGCQDGGQWCFPFDGELDEVKLVSCALTEDEVAQDHATGWPWTDDD